MSDRIEAAARAAWEQRRAPGAIDWDDLTIAQPKIAEMVRAEITAALGAADAWDAEHGIRHVELEQCLAASPKFDLFRIVSERKEDS